mmetsp:Transcript_21776/g.37487  ORF Transcript_21776/g.37487 Transcript_21776/m.37487 type:complete len:81 (-) Transcript_21776:642-884(-)
MAMSRIDFDTVSSCSLSTSGTQAAAIMERTSPRRAPQKRINGSTNALRDTSLEISSCAGDRRLKTRNAKYSFWLVSHSSP